MGASRRWTAAAVSGALAAAGLTWWAVGIEPYRLQVEDLVVPCAGLHGPVRLLLFSDVDFPSDPGRERRVAEVASEFQPDLVLVAGDLLDRHATVGDAALRERAAAWVGAMPAGAGRFLAPGEEETWQRRELDRAFSRHGLRALANTRLLLDVRGDRIDLLVADPPRQTAPWDLATEGARTFLHCRGRLLPHRLTYRDAGAIDWGDLELTFAFRLDDPRSEVAVHLANWTLSRTEERRAFHAGEVGSDFVPPHGVWCRARVRLRAGHLQARFWREGSREPDAWAIEVSDPKTARPGKGTLALGGRRRGKAFDDLRLVSRGQLVLEEAFDSRKGLLARWSDPSAIAAWARHPLPGTVRLVLAHSPDVVLDLAAAGGPPPCLVLSGHTHGGQIQLPLLGPLHTGIRLPRRYAQGLHRYRGIPVYVTRGVGTSVIHARFLAPPEVTRVTLVPGGRP
jgi:predicted MPP superfamily phosphohydrolase